MSTYDAEEGRPITGDTFGNGYSDICSLLYAQRRRLFIKRIFDIALSAISLPVLSVFFIFISIIIKADSRGPVYYRQTRVGRHGKLFRIYKFRTMVVNADKSGKLITVGDDSRVTRTGKFLRKTKIDELPQIINVLIGEMSFVGPRPEVPKYVELYSESQKQILLVRPGITDIASIQFRNESKILASSNDPEKKYIEEIMPCKLVYNMQYLRNISVINDIRIIILTVFKVLK